MKYLLFTPIPLLWGMHCFMLDNEYSPKPNYYAWVNLPSGISLALIVTSPFLQMLG
jgi:hypothetical protein